MAGAASQAGDADSSRAPGLTSGLQGSVNVHLGARAETIHRGFDFVRFVLLGSEFNSFSVFSVRSVSIFSHTNVRS